MGAATLEQKLSIGDRWAGENKNMKAYADITGVAIPLVILVTTESWDS